MTDDKKAMLDFLCGEAPYDGAWFGDVRLARPFWWRTHLRKAFADDLEVVDKKPEPVASVTVSHFRGLMNRDLDYWGELPDGTHLLYAAPPAREWVGLTDEELAEMHHLDQFGLFCDADEFHDIARAIEAALREKNT